MAGNLLVESLVLYHCGALQVNRPSSSPQADLLINILRCPAFDCFEALASYLLLGFQDVRLDRIAGVMTAHAASSSLQRLACSPTCSWFRVPRAQQPALIVVSNATPGAFYERTARLSVLTGSWQRVHAMQCGGQTARQRSHPCIQTPIDFLVDLDVFYAGVKHDFVAFKAA